MWGDAKTRNEVVVCVVRLKDGLLDTHSIWSDWDGAREAVRRLNEQSSTDEWRTIDRVLWTTLPKEVAK